MLAEQVRETMQQYAEVLLARGDYGRFFHDEMEFEVMGTDQQTRGAQAAEQASASCTRWRSTPSRSSEPWWWTTTERLQKPSSSEHIPASS
jgi:hypothetical protein